MNILESEVPVRKWKTLTFDGVVDLADVADKILSDTGIRLIKTGPNQILNGFLVSEVVGGKTVVDVYLYKEKREKNVTKVSYEKGVVTEQEVPELQVFIPSTLDEKKVDSIKLKDLKGTPQVILKTWHTVRESSPNN